MTSIRRVLPTTFLLASGVILLLPGQVRGHCDAMDGPVVRAAQQALTAGDVKLVLIWVPQGDKETIRDAFDRTLAVRGLSAAVRDLADIYFFETLVRVHRAGEGAAYTGLKPAGLGGGPAILRADEALATGDVFPLQEFIANAIGAGLSERFEELLAMARYSSADIPAGRAFIGAYVELIHYVERAYEAASHAIVGHFPDQHSPAGGHDGPASR